MDWSKLLKFKVLDKKLFTLYAFLILITSFLMLWFFNKLLFPRSIESIQDFFKKIFETRQEKGIFAPELILVTLFLLVFVWVWIVILPILWMIIQEITAKFPFFCKTKEFFPNDCLTNLIFQGRVVKRGPKCFSITNSDSGALIKHHYWKDFSITFQFNFEGSSDGLKRSFEKDYIKVKNKGNLYEEKLHSPKNNFLGFIFRAQNLDNYFMISIGIKDVVNPHKSLDRDRLSYSQQLLLTPHIRVNGAWEVFSSEPYPDNLKTKLMGNQPHTVTIRVQGTKLDISFDEINYDPFVWKLPTNFRTNWPDKKVEIRGEEYSFGDESIITFRNNYGMIGFRAYGQEKVLINGVSVTQL